MDESNALKAIRSTDDELIVGNYIVLFGGRDLEGVLSPRKNEDGTVGEFFTEKTALDSSYTKTGVLYVDWEHGLGKHKDGEGAPGRNDVLGYVDWKTAKADERGVWVERALNRRNTYMEWLEELIEEGIIGNSTEAAPEGVEIKATGEIAKWPLKRDTMTLTPMEPRMISENALAALKALQDKFPSAKAMIDAASLEAVLEVDPASQENSQEGDTGTATADGVTVNVTVVQPTPTERAKMEVKTMADENEKTPERMDWQDRMEKVEAGIAGQSTGQEEIKGQLSDITALLDSLAKSPSLKDAGYISPDSEGTERATVKSFGDYLLAIRNGNESRLATVYGSVKALGEQSGTTGGFMVPEDYNAQLMMLAQDAALVRPLATKFPTGSNRGSVPALNHTTAPTAGKGYSAFAGGVVASWTPEAGTLTVTDPAFEMIEYNINKLGGYTLISNELISDSAIAVESLINMLFGRAIAAKEDYAFLRGTGSGEPLGIFTAPATIAVTTNADNTFALIDAINMLTQFQPVSASTASIRWVLHRGVLPDFVANFDVTTGGVDWVQPREGLPGSMLGYPMVFNEHMPAVNTDDVLLADFAGYLIFDNQGLQIAYSEHSAFTSDQGTWKFTKRLDGQPWLSGPIYLADPAGATTVSPFLYHND